MFVGHRFLQLTIALLWLPVEFDVLVITDGLEVCSHPPINACTLQHSQGLAIQEVVGYHTLRKSAFPQQKVPANVKLVAVVLLQAVTTFFVVEVAGLKVGRTQQEMEKSPLEFFSVHHAEKW